MGPVSINGRLLFLFHIVCSTSMPSDIVPTGNFLKANLIPKYFERILQNRDNVSLDSYVNGLSPMCQENYAEWIADLQRNYNNLIKAQSWTLQMLDSWGKAPEGLLSGHVTAMGDFDECLSIRTDTFHGKYCTNNLIFLTDDEQGDVLSDSMQFSDSRSVTDLLELLAVMGKTETRVFPSIASCLPSSCNDLDVQLIVQNVLNSSGIFDYAHPVTINCVVDRKPPLTTGSISMLVILVTLLVLCVSGTTLDVLRRYGYITTPGPCECEDSYRVKETLCKILLAFSVAKNAKKILNTNAPPGNLECLHGIRFLSAFWVIIGHTFYMHVIQPLWNLLDFSKAPQENILTLVVVNGGVVVDTFLTVSGVLVAFNVLKTLDKCNGKLNIPLMYLSRYLRLTPIYALVIGIAATLFPYVSSGPKWFVVEAWATFCQKNWWKNLLYVNNLPIYNDTFPESTDKLCYGESWYLGADMQLFLLSPILIYPLWKWKRAGVAFLFITTLISIIVPFTKTYVDNLLPTSLPFRPSGDFTHQAYMATWMRASPYLMGIWTGYFLHLTRRSFKMPHILLLACWSIAISSSLAVLLGIQKYFDWRYEIPRIEGAVYAGFNHAIWGICIGWLIFACVRGYGGWVNRFLSWRVFIPLGRLSYAIYLVSFHLQFLLHYSYRQPIHYSAYNAVNISFSHLVMCLIVAFVFSLTMESPFMELEKMIFKKTDPAKEQLHIRNTYRNYGTRHSEEGEPETATNA